jgi:hypothetical protein
MLKQAGFSSVSVEKIPEDPFNLHFFCRKLNGSACTEKTLR